MEPAPRSLPHRAKTNSSAARVWLKLIPMKMATSHWRKFRQMKPPVLRILTQTATARSALKKFWVSKKPVVKRSAVSAKRDAQLK